MAFTNSPINSTYSTHRLPTAYTLSMRPGGGSSSFFDEGMKNLLVYKDGDNVVAETRPAIKGYQIANASGSTIEGHALNGMYVWSPVTTGQANTYYFVSTWAGDVYYSIGGVGAAGTPNFKTWTLLCSLSSSAPAAIRFCEFISATNVQSLVVVNGYDGYVISGSATFQGVPTAAHIVDVDFPVPHVPFPIFLDGYLFLAKQDTGDIYNSDLNNPASWTAGSFISSEMYPDTVQALVKVKNYILAIGTNGSEYFYDAAVATGSPLARMEAAALPFGTIYPESIAASEDTVVLLANQNDGQPVFNIIKDQQYKQIDCPALAEYFDYLYRYSQAGGGGVDFQRAFFFRDRGTLYYYFTLSSQQEDPKTNPYNFPLSIAYSIETGIWTEFTSNPSTISGTTTNCSIGFAFQSVPNTYNSLTTGIPPDGPFTTYIAGTLNAFGSSTSIPYFGVFTRTDFFGTGNNAYDEVFNNAASGTGSQTYLRQLPILNEIRTPNIDFGTSNRKFMSRFVVDLQASDKTYSSGFGSTALTVEWSDDDHNTFSTAITPETDTDTPTTFRATQLGSFRRRSFRVRYYGKKFIRWNYFEVDINKGQQ